MKPKVLLVEQGRCSKLQKSNDTRGNEWIICGNKTFRKSSKLYRLCETERGDLLLHATKFNMGAVSTKIPILDKPEDLFAADIMIYKQCMSR